jgi:rubrerythrin
VPSKNQRVELEMKIMKYRQMAQRVTDDETRQRIDGLVAEQEQKLREIDE